MDRPNDKVIKAIKEVLKKVPDRSQGQPKSFSVNQIKQRMFDSEHFERCLEKRRLGIKVFSSILEDLTDEEVQGVVSVMHLGRGDFSSYEQALNFNLNNAPSENQRKSAIDYMYGKVPFKDYLRNGLKRLNIRTFCN